MRKKKNKDNEYVGFIAEIKQNIIRSRYQAARLANRELLLLYLYVGKQLSEKIEAKKWGEKVLHKISNDLQKELPGLRGFSERNLKNMRQFADEYTGILFGQSPTAQIGKSITQLSTAQSKNVIRQSATAQLKRKKGQTILTENQTNSFFSVSFTHHIMLLAKCKKLEERFFYMQSASAEMWSVLVLEHQINARLYKHRGKLPNNFSTTIPEKMRASALSVFKDEYLFDFMSLEEDEDERVFEEKIVASIRDFILRMGRGFCFIGNQHRLEVASKEYFVDLLFYNRILQRLVAFDLKKGAFKPEHFGKMNYYLNALNDTVKLEHEEPSIGIILCKEKNNTEVEYAIRGITNAMGVATYKLSNKMPQELKGILPDTDKLRKLL